MGLAEDEVAVSCNRRTQRIPAVESVAMIPIDPATLFLVNAISLLMFAVVYLVAWWRGSDRPYWLNLAMSEIVFAIAFVMFARLIDGDSHVLLVPNVLLVAALGLRWRALHGFFGYRARVIWTLAAALLVSGALLAADHCGKGLAFGAVNIVLILQMLAIMSTLWRATPRLPSRWGLIVAYLIMLLSSVLRVGEGWLLHPGMTSLLPLDGLLAVHLGAAAIHIVASGAFSLSLAYERGIADLRRMASRDALTELLNRRGLQEALSNAPIKGCGLAIDIDDFKQINDRHGHPAGDQVIMHCAGIIHRWTREQDLVARIGGEEFFVWLPGSSQEQGRQVAEQIRLAIESRSVNAGGLWISYTASIGVRHGGSGPSSFSQLMVEADRALYRAKAAGRNCVRSG